MRQAIRDSYQRRSAYSSLNPTLISLSLETKVDLNHLRFTCIRSKNLEFPDQIDRRNAYVYLSGCNSLLHLLTRPNLFPAFHFTSGQNRKAVTPRYSSLRKSVQVGLCSSVAKDSWAVSLASNEILLVLCSLRFSLFSLFSGSS
ncbi:hypothetical protein PoB_006867900 [Plakobranchus ocellatus]|uniref:Uncharacterized protein n=1 Tax=Plakobranchus ocellatus TaxID=259542 RepID=A0AAV4DDB6_9GAST|nr:hypothetical protein PoB_006867900 [Plakobranchus ocellatus]